MRGHPRDYIPAVQAMGSNAVPFLLRELSVKDSFWERWGEECLRRALDSSTPWQTARNRHYYAFLALQVLGSNAVPAMIEAVLRPPLHLGDAERSSEVAHALAGMSSPIEARRAIGAALVSPDLALRLAACRAYSAGIYADLPEARCLIQLSAVPNPTERAAATRALVSWKTNEAEVLPALVARLEDEQAAVRRLAIDALAARGSNAIAALPALLAAYTNELARPRLTANVDHLYYGAAISIAEVRWAIRWAIGEVDRAAQPPWDNR